MKSNLIYLQNGGNLAINYQLFADTTMTTATSDISATITKYEEERLIRLAEPSLIHDQFGVQYDIPQRKGTTIEMRGFVPLSEGKVLTEGVTPDASGLQMFTVTSQLKQYGDYVRMSDLVNATSKDNLVAESVNLMGGQAGRTLDTVTREIINSGTNVMRVNDRASRKDITGTDILTLDWLTEAKTFLSMQSAPTFDDDCYVAIVNSNVIGDLMRLANEDNFISIAKYADPSKIYKGEIGTFNRIRIVENPRAKAWIDGGNGTSVFSTLVLGKGAFGVTKLDNNGLQMIIKELGSGGTSDPLNQRMTVGWKATKTAEILVQQYMVRLESGATTAFQNSYDEQE
jgi:N4-gp56 family major capsid protein